MMSGFQEQELAVGNYRKEMETISEEIKTQLGLQDVEGHVKVSVEKPIEEFNSQFQMLSSKMSHDIEIKTKELNEGIDRLNKKTSEIKKNLDHVSKCLPADVRRIQKPKNLLHEIETFQRGAAIEQFVNRKLSVQYLIDSFLFGSAEDQIAFESLCLKWTVKHIDLLTPTVGDHEYMSDIFPVYGCELKAQLMLKINSCGIIRLYLCFKDEEKNGKQVGIQIKPMVTFIIKDLSGQSNHLIRNQYYLHNKSLEYNEFGYFTYPMERSQWNALISSCDMSLEVLVLVEPLTIINKPLSVDGTITDTIENYSRKLQKVKEGLIKGHLAPPFLTHAGGYSVAVWMLLDDPVGKTKKGLAAGIWFFSGEFDSQLGIEFEHETSVTLINHLDAKKNITVKQQTKEVKYNRIEIASEDAIDSGGFLVNDSLTYHVTIKPINQLITK